MTNQFHGKVCGLQCTCGGSVGFCFSLMSIDQRKKKLGATLTGAQPVEQIAYQHEGGWGDP